MTMSLDAVTAFVRETNDHSGLNIGTLIDALDAVGNVRLAAVANGCAVSGALRARCEASPSVTLVETKQNIGVPAAWNLGLDTLGAGGRHVLVVNDDVWFDRRCAEEIAKTLDAMPDTAVAGLEGQVCRTTDEQGFPREEKHFGKKRRLFKRIRVVPVTKVDGFFFALSRHFLVNTRFRFDTRFTPAFCEELDLAFTARSLGYKTRVVTGLDDHYRHVYGISASDCTIRYLDTSITTAELARRNIGLFAEKWAADMTRLIRP